jgi:hypothetical protein
MFWCSEASLTVRVLPIFVATTESSVGDVMAAYVRRSGQIVVRLLHAPSAAELLVAVPIISISLAAVCAGTS